MGHDAYTEDMAAIMAYTRERREVMAILQAWDEGGLPDDFHDGGVKFAFNRNSGNVFLVNEDHDVAMMNGDELESFYTSPYEGKEGFFSDLLKEYPDMHREDQEWFRELAKGRDAELPAVEE